MTYGIPPARYTVDQLIVAIIERRVVPTKTDTMRIAAHISQAPFVRALVDVSGFLQQPPYSMAARLPSLEAHWAKRVYEDQEWAPTVTQAEYHHDLQTSVLQAGSIYVAYADKAGGRTPGLPTVGIVAPNMIPSSHKGSYAKDQVWVIYSASKRAIINGYQKRVSRQPRTGDDRIWLP